MNFHDNSKNKNQKIDFSFDSAHCASFIIIGAKLREEWGACKSIVGKKPELHEYIYYIDI